MIRFSKYIWLYFFISTLVLVPGVYSLIRWGLRPSIDFTGGTLIEVQENNHSQILRFKNDEPEKIASITALFSSASPSAVILRQETVGPILGKELLQKATGAAVVAVVAILAYVAYAFRNIRFGVSAIIALGHDLLVVLGVFSLLGHYHGVEVDTLFVTAFLTTMSFSVHDTIVVFDRIREYRKKDAKTPLVDICDRALTETMGRSLTNSFTIIFMLVALLLLGGETIRWFIAALLVGTISGTYSSPFVATPMLILWDKWEKRV